MCLALWAPFLDRNAWAQGASEEKPKTTDPSPALKDRAIRLNVGDLAPPLQVSKWLQGPEVSSFVPGKVYVVQFWAVWCNPCIGHMPHLSKLQADYQGQGVSVIAYTTRDFRGGPSNNEQDIAAFLKKRGKILHYAVAYADARSMADPWLAGQDGFWTFVIDKTGRVAYIGNALFLDLVLPRVLAAKASAREIGEEVARIIAEYKTMHAELVRAFEAGNPAPALKSLRTFTRAHPEIADISPLAQAKLSLLPKYGEPGEGKTYAKELLAKAIASKDFLTLNLIRSILRDQKEDKEFLAMTVEAAEAYLRFDPLTSAQGWLDLAEAYTLVGNASKAKESARRAITQAAKDPVADRPQVEKEARRFGASP